MRRHLRKAGSEQGGALVEFALSTLLLVPLALYSMYVGEAYMASIKAQEAEIAGGWEMTAFRLHDYLGGSADGLYSSAISVATSRVKAQMPDLNSFAENGQGLRTTVGQSRLSYFECGNRNGPKIGPSMGTKYLEDDGYVGCKAQVEFKNHYLPRDAFRDLQHDGPQLLPSSIATLRFCGLGPGPTGCDRNGKLGGMVLLTNDYGLEVGKANPVGTSQNRRYFNVGEAIYSSDLRSYTGAAAVTSAMATLLGLGDLGQTSDFKMGYLENVSKERSISPHHGGKKKGHLSPYNDLAQGVYAEKTGLSKLIYNERSEDNYLAQPNARFNAP